MVRYQIPDDEREPGGPHLTDAVGEVVAVAGDAVVIHTRRGEVRIPREAIVLARRVPPPVPPPARSFAPTGPPSPRP